MKKLVGLLIFAFFNCLLCSAEIKIGLLNGPSCIPVAALMEKTGTDNNLEYNFQKFADPQALLPKLLKKEIDVGFMPLNLACKVFNSGNKGIICCGITGYGNLSLITKDASITSIKDLQGKTVNVAGQGATPEYIFKYLLNKNKIEINSLNGVILDFSIPTAQMVPSLLSGKIEYAVVPEPFATIAKMKSPQIKAIDLQKEYISVAGAESLYPLTVIVVSKSFVKEHEDKLKACLAEFNAAWKWTVNNPEKAGLLAEKHELGLAADVVSSSIPNANYCFETFDNAEAVEICNNLLTIFLENDENSIGGKLPSMDFYFK